MATAHQPLVAQRRNEAAVIAKALGIRESQVRATIDLLEAGNTVPFIARYRKEATGELDENVIRNIGEKMEYARNLLAKKEEVTRHISEQGKLTRELELAIERATILSELEDIYRPYRPKRRTRATIAKEKGLEGLANIIGRQAHTTGSYEDHALSFVNAEKGVSNWEQAIEGALDILAENLSDDPKARAIVRNLMWEEGSISSKGDAEKLAETEFVDYIDFSEPLKRIPPHRILALNRGESKQMIKVKAELEAEKALARLSRHIVVNPDTIFIPLLSIMVADAYKRLIFPSMEREIRGMLTQRAEEQAIRIFGTNLRALLLQPPIKNLRVLGIDPGFRTGSKVAVVDETGKVLETATVYPHAPHNKVMETKLVLADLILRHQAALVAIGNGTASRETEMVVAEMLRDVNRDRDAVHYIMVSEAGASVYSASPLAGDELGEMDVTMRGAVSIARRCQDPLAELVKIEPKALGVGQYQHDVDQKRLQETLEGVVESCVNYVGVDLNTASPALLQYVAGMQASVARNVVAYRDENGRFTSRQELRRVPRLGDMTFQQCAGFLRIPDGSEFLDNTQVHPESYHVAREVLKILGYDNRVLADKSTFDALKNELAQLDASEIAQEMEVGVPTVKDIIVSLQKPGRDPREELPKPLLRTDVLSIDDLRAGMVLSGTVRNVVDFGAFVDIGVKQDGLVHISEMCDRFIKHPTEFLQLGDIVSVKVIGVDKARRRISLSMKLTSEEAMVH